MTTMHRVYLDVAPDGRPTARTDDLARLRAAKAVAVKGLDGRLLRLFEGWMAQRDRTWTIDEIRAFGQLLHRTLFADTQLWQFVKQRMDAAKEADQVFRLLLGFSADGAGAALATLPWEYLHTPDDNPGFFLAEDKRLVLCRQLFLGSLDPDEAPAERVRVLPVVSDADPRRLGPVDPEPVLEVMRKAAATDAFEILPALATCEETDESPGMLVTERALVAAVKEARPDIVHFMGHGQFVGGVGSVALQDEESDRVWVDETRFAHAVCAADRPPKVVVLHTCEGGQTDFTDRFAGLAPALISRNVRSVVAMQYVVAADTASDFSALLYEALGAGEPVDVAVQTARRTLRAEAPRDYRLLGMPMVYLRNAAPLLAGPGGSGNGGSPG